MPPRIVLLHATPVAMQPIQAAFAAQWPEAETVNLLDDGLSLDRAREPDLSEAMIQRFVEFGVYGKKMGADGILVTCSAFGPAIDRLTDAVPIPVLKPNEAMFHAALAQGENIGMLATFAPSVGTMTDEFNEFVAQSGKAGGGKAGGGKAGRLTTVLVADAIDLMKQGDADSHNRLVAARAPELAECDAIMLAHFSTSRAAAAVRAVVSVPVLTAPDTAVERMRSLVESRAGA